MPNNYEKPELTVVIISPEDIIATSQPGGCPTDTMCILDSICKFDWD